MKKKKKKKREDNMDDMDNMDNNSKSDSGDDKKPKKKRKLSDEEKQENWIKYEKTVSQCERFRNHMGKHILPYETPTQIKRKYCQKPICVYCNLVNNKLAERIEQLPIVSNKKILIFPYPKLPTNYYDLYGKEDKNVFICDAREDYDYKNKKLKYRYKGLIPDIIIILQDTYLTWRNKWDPDLPIYKEMFRTCVLPVIQNACVKTYVIQEQFAQISYWSEKDRREGKEKEVKEYNKNRPSVKEYFENGAWELGIYFEPK